MNRLACGAMLALSMLVLTGCLESKERRIAKCRYEAAKLLAGGDATNNIAETGRMTVLCMEAEGYKFSPTDSQRCSQSSYDPECYKFPTTF